MAKKHSNGSSRPGRPGRPIVFAPRLSGWKAIQLNPFTNSVDPTQPIAYQMDVEGQRSDDVVFKVRVALDKRKIDMVPSPLLVLEIARQSIQNAITQLQTFRDCKCGVDTSCKEHQSQ